MSRYFHDYDNVTILDLNEELAMGEHVSDSVRLAERARASNVHDESKIWPSMWHVFQSSAAFVPEARQSIDEIGRFVVNHVG